VYKPAFAFDHAVDLMSKHRGEHFDPELLDVFLASLPDIKRIHEQYADKPPLGFVREP
jgi:putative two-component system response regulator